MICQAFSEVLLTVEDVDEDDADQPQLCSQYVKDIYNYLHDLEVKVPSTVQRHRGRDLNEVVVSAGAAGCTTKLHAGLRNH